MHNENDAWARDQYQISKFAQALELQLRGKYEDAAAAEQGTRAAADRTLTLAVNAPWGKGKSFFLEGFVQQLKSNHVVVTFDAWETDFAGNPLVAFCLEVTSQIAATTGIGDSVKDELKKAAGQLFFHYAKHMVGGVFSALLSTAVPAGGVLASGALKGIEGAGNQPPATDEDCVEKMQAEYTSIKKSINAMRDVLANLVETVSKSNDLYLPIFIVVDELDRCRPNYAIELLENIKHIFEVEGVYFVFGISLDSLAHSIQAVYGNGFDGRAYLDRFFSLEYSLPIASNFDYIHSALKEKYIIDFKKLIILAPSHHEGIDREASRLLGKIASWYEMTPRDIDKACLKLSMILKESNAMHALPLFVLLCYWQCNKTLSASLFKKIKNGEAYGELFAGTSKKSKPYIEIGEGNHDVDQVFSIYMIVARKVANERDSTSSASVISTAVWDSALSRLNSHSSASHSLGHIMEYPDLITSGTLNHKRGAP
ncbi:KAP family P-loop NTPase fold protein [Chitinimonas sp. JJ19]|uniref:KAP family P-loop NTPase fold protein n=1 Tax=Chitinimonas sp. JJ19 TaxID=3109352 RepID=UPI003002EE63